MRPTQKYVSLLCILAVIIVTCLVYTPGLSGGFLFDDTINIIENPKVLANSFEWQELYRAAFSYGSGGFNRSISMLSLGINHALTGLDPFYFKLTNLVIHLLCGIGLWLLSRLLLNAYRIRYQLELVDNEIEWISIAVSAVWLLHPFNLTSVLYIVQRMASLTALFMIFGLMLYVAGRLRQLQGQHGATLMVVGVVVFGALAVLSKENGVVLPLLVLITEWSIFGFQAPDRSTRRFVMGFIVVTAIIPSLLALGFLIIRFDWLLGGYQLRDFTLNERLLTQPRVLWFYIQMILLSDPTRMGLYHDDIPISKGWFEPLTTLPAVLGILVLLAGAFFFKRRAPLLTFGILFFFVGHAIESSIVPLEIAHEHRNYLPAYGLIFIAIYYLSHRVLRERLSSRTQVTLIAVLILLLAVGTANRASYWANDVEMALMEVRHHPASARTNMQAGYIVFQLAEHGIKPGLNFKRARQYFENARHLDSHNLTSDFALLVLDDKENHPIDSILIDQLVGKLANRPLAWASINSLIRLSRCQFDGLCKLPPEILNRLFQGITQNPTLRGKPRAQVLTELAQFAILQNELSIALYVTHSALEIDPNNPQIYLNYAHLLIHFGEFEKAQQVIEKARALDKDLFFANRIQAQEILAHGAKNMSPRQPSPYGRE